MSHALEVVRAGAGSGKTTDLCRAVVAAVSEGLDPARILATTFTKKAAAELKGRIQCALLEDTANDAIAARRHADGFDLAAIGTVHSVGHQMLQRYAIPLGLSPRLKVLVESSQGRVLNDLLGSMAADAWEQLAGVSERLSIMKPYSLMLPLLAAKRVNRISDDAFRQQMGTSADRLCELLAPQGPQADAPRLEHLHTLVARALVDIEELTDDTSKVTDKARQTLRRMQSQRSNAWSSYVHASKLKAGVGSGANRALEELRAHGGTVRHNPMLHADVRRFANVLTEQVIGLARRYQEYKAERGLVDFTDLEVLFLSLLENAELTNCLCHEFDLVLVDEFQDTNPLQLAIFARLRRLVRRNRWVGDPKQAIFGFRGTDPQLVNAVWQTARDALRTELPRNYRSQKGLVQLTGKLFEPIFGDTAVQEPSRASMPRGIERWLLKSKNQPDDAISLACGVAALNAEGIPFGDIAILERTNNKLDSLTTAFDDLGIPYLIESPGLLSTREGAIVLAGLRLVADRGDSLAAAQILHILSEAKEQTPAWISERLTAIRDLDAARDAQTAPARHFAQPWAGDERLIHLEQIDRNLASPSQVVQQVMEALHVPTLLSQWGDAARRSSHLDSLLQLAAEYEESALEAGSSATLSGLILHLEALADEDNDLRLPPLGHDAVTLTTYHSAKGLEWPVVILSGLSWKRDPNMWSPVVKGGDPSHADPLTGRTLRFWPWPFSFSDGPFPKPLTGTGLDADALQSPEGQAQSEEEQEEALRLLYVGVTRAKDKLVFAHRVGDSAWLDRLANVNRLLDCERGDGEHALDGVDTTYVLRSLDPSLANDALQPQLKPQPDSERWLLSTAVSELPSLQERYHQPSRAPSPPSVSECGTEQLPGPSYFPSGAKEKHYAAIGDAVHAYLAAIPSMAKLTKDKKQTIAARCLAAHSVSGFLAPADLVSAGDRFITWVRSKYPDATWHTETYLSSPRQAGGQWSGTVDLLLQLPSGEFVVIDHKSAPLRREHCAKKAATYAGQLGAYCEALAALDKHVVTTWIHFPLAGAMAQLPPGES